VRARRAGAPPRGSQTPDEYVEQLGRVVPSQRSTLREGSEKAWFYVAIWTVVPTQVISWGMWRLGKTMALSPHALTEARFVTFFLCTALFFVLGWRGSLPRTERYHVGPLRVSAD